MKPPTSFFQNIKISCVTFFPSFTKIHHFHGIVQGSFNYPFTGRSNLMQMYGNVEGFSWNIVHFLGLVSYTDPCRWWLIIMISNYKICLWEAYLSWIYQMFESKWLAIHPPMVMVINITIDISQMMCFLNYQLITPPKFKIAPKIQRLFGGWCHIMILGFQTPWVWR